MIGDPVDVAAFARDPLAEDAEMLTSAVRMKRKKIPLRLRVARPIQTKIKRTSKDHRIVAFELALLQGDRRVAVFHAELDPD